MSVFVCLCVCLFVCLSVSVSANLSLELHDRSTPIFMHVTYGRSSVLLRRPCDMLRISGFVNDVISALMFRR